MNSCIEPDELIDIRKIYSEGNVETFNSTNAAKIVSRDVGFLIMNPIIDWKPQFGYESEDVF